jgi:hypothetical protein
MPRRVWGYTVRFESPYRSCATDIVIEVEPHAGHHITAVVSDVDHEKDPMDKTWTLRVPALLAEETRHLVLAVKLAEQKQPLPRALGAGEVRIRYTTLVSGGQVTTEKAEAKLKVLIPRRK